LGTARRPPSFAPGRQEVDGQRPAHFGMKQERL
jgi:hypothetical protein